MRNSIITLVISFLLIANLSAQSKYSLEAGVNLGVVSYQTDYGERGDFKSEVYGNLGFAYGASFYVNFFNRRASQENLTPFVKHFKVKGELSYLKAKLEHFGDLYSNPTSEATIKISKMHGTSSVLNAGAILEYHFLDLSRFTAKKDSHMFSPFVGLGAMVNLSNPTVETTYGNGNINDPNNLPSSYQGAINQGSETIFSVLMNVGTRMKLNYRTDLVLDSRWQYFTSDNIDGINPKIAANAANDWMYFLSTGIVFTFD